MKTAYFNIYQYFKEWHVVGETFRGKAVHKIFRTREEAEKWIDNNKNLLKE